MRQKIAICIPTHNEADTVGTTTTKIDIGLRKYLSDFEVIIVNADNNSTDGTKKYFLSSKTDSKKKYLKSSKLGKGNNLVNFLLFCKLKDIDFAATIDSDIKTLDSVWIERLLSPIISNKADFVTPLYFRNRFEGSTTNHFAFPLVYTFFGTSIRQPIGGEFSFNRSFIKYCLRKPISSEVKQYGIDIFLTIHALGGNFRVEEAFLGRKLHKSSFPKLVPMFKQVFASAIQTSSSYDIYREQADDLSLKNKPSIDNYKDFKHEVKIKELANFAREQFANNNSLYLRNNLGSYPLIEKKVFSSSAISIEDWSDILSDILVLGRKNKLNDSGVLAEIITPIFVLRTITFWLEINNIKPSKIDFLLNYQAKMIRSKTLKKLDGQKKRLLYLSGTATK